MSDVLVVRESLPQHEGPQKDVGWWGHLELAALVPPVVAGPEHDGGDEPRDATDQVHRPRPGHVDHSELVQPADRGPHPVSGEAEDDGVQQWKEEIWTQLGPLGHGSCKVKQSKRRNKTVWSVWDIDKQETQPNTQPLDVSESATRTPLKQQRWRPGFSLANTREVVREVGPVDTFGDSQTRGSDTLGGINNGPCVSSNWSHMYLAQTSLILHLKSWMFCQLLSSDSHKSFQHCLLPHHISSKRGMMSGFNFDWDQTRSSRMFFRMSGPKRTVDPFCWEPRGWVLLKVIHCDVDPYDSSQRLPGSTDPKWMRRKSESQRKKQTVEPSEPRNRSRDNFPFLWFSWFKLYVVCQGGVKLLPCTLEFNLSFLQQTQDYRSFRVTSD